MATVVLLGTLDTKGVECEFLRQRVRDEGCDVILIDVGVRGSPLTVPDISRYELARHAHTTIGELAAEHDRSQALRTMATAATMVVLDLLSQGRLDGILAVGGSGNSSIAASVMQVLPIGTPKLLVSTQASGDTRPYVGAVDVTMMYSVVDISGINRVSEPILRNAAAAIAAMARAHSETRYMANGKPLVATTMFGVTTPGVTYARERLESRGYEVLVFHATGIGGRSMEALLASGAFVGVLDITTTELADELVGGMLSAGPDRLEAAGKLGIPQIVSLGALDLVNFGPDETVPPRYRSRHLYKYTPAVTLMRTTPEECTELGRIIARKLNAASGPTALFIPLRGISMLSVEGQVFHNPDADRALIDSLRTELHANVEVHEFDTSINDERFAYALADRLDDILCGRRDFDI